MFHKLKNIISRITHNDSKKHLKALNINDQQLIASIKKKNLTYLPDQKLASIAKTCHVVEEMNLPGIFIEAGCALGGSAILISKLKKAERPFFIYDVFGMIPPPTADDTKDVHNRYRIIVEGKSTGIGNNKYYGYEDNLYDLVQSNLKSFGIGKDQPVSLIKGLLQETMQIDRPVAFAHIDVDWYDPVKTCLERIFPKLVIGGSIILDDYRDWGGCHKATDEYLSAIPGQYISDDADSSMKITRIK